MMLRDARVLARVNEAGELIAGSDGRVEVRYKPSDTRSYRASKRNLEAIEGEALLPDDAVVAAAVGGGGKEAAAKRANERKHAADAIIIYADGACSGNPGPAGLGVVLQDGGARRELSQFLGQGTNNIAELTAILEAADAIEDPSCPAAALSHRQVRWRARTRQPVALARRAPAQATAASHRNPRCRARAQARRQLSRLGRTSEADLRHRRTRLPELPRPHEAARDAHRRQEHRAIPRQAWRAD
jgi:ribonuclease HI